MPRTQFPFFLLASLCYLIGQPLVTIKPLNTLYSLFFWGSYLSLVSKLFCSALILIHTLESQSLKGPLHFPFSQAVSISTLIEWIVFNIGLLQQALNTRMLTQRFLFCLFSPLLPHELGLWKRVLYVGILYWPQI